MKRISFFRAAAAFLLSAAVLCSCGASDVSSADEETPEVYEVEGGSAAAIALATEKYPEAWSYFSYIAPTKRLYLTADENGELIYNFKGASKIRKDHVWYLEHGVEYPEEYTGDDYSFRILNIGYLLELPDTTTFYTVPEIVTVFRNNTDETFVNYMYSIKLEVYLDGEWWATGNVAYENSIQWMNYHPGDSIREIAFYTYPYDLDTPSVYYTLPTGDYKYRVVFLLQPQDGSFEYSIIREFQVPDGLLAEKIYVNK